MAARIDLAASRNLPRELESKPPWHRFADAEVREAVSGSQRSTSPHEPQKNLQVGPASSFMMEYGADVSREPKRLSPHPDQTQTPLRKSEKLSSPKGPDKKPKQNLRPPGLRVSSSSLSALQANSRLQSRNPESKASHCAPKA